MRVKESEEYERLVEKVEGEGGLAVADRMLKLIE